MAESRLCTLSVDFAIQVLNWVKFLKSQHETIVFSQIGRVGINIHGEKNMTASLSGSMLTFFDKTET